MRTAVDRAGGLAGDCHLVRVTTKGGDVAVDPAHRKLLAHQPIIMGPRRRQFGIVDVPSAIPSQSTLRVPRCAEGRNPLG